MRNEIEHFFAMYKEPEGRKVTIHGWEDRDVAERLLAEARERFAAQS
jgi:inorganic pyrophosphatase